MSSGFLQQLYQVKAADIEWRDEIPFSREFQDIYFNPADGLAESEYVFLAGNELPQDWLNPQQQSFSIGELGFGSGLNFLMTASAWRNNITQRKDAESCHLHFVSIEKRPMTRQDFWRATAHWPQFAELRRQLFDQYPSPSFGRYQLFFPEWQTTLTLVLMPVEQALDDLLYESENRAVPLTFDHWFFDGFAPAKNDSMWSEKVCLQVARLSKQGARLASFSVSGKVKQPLSLAGFSIKKKKGFGRKREMLTAILSETVSQNTKQRDRYVNWQQQAPWQKLGVLPAKPKVAIIGAGIAGCATAYVLARCNIESIIFEQQASIAAKASGAAAGIFHPQLTKDMNLNSQFQWLAYLELLRYLQRLSPSQVKRVILSQGLVRFLDNTQTVATLLKLAEDFNWQDWLGLPPTNLRTPSFSRAVHFPLSAALDMKALCHTFLDNIGDDKCTLNLNHSVNHLSYQNGKWQLVSNDNDYLFDHIIFCGGAKSQLQDHWLAIDTHTSRGQTCLVEAPTLASSLSSTLCEETYIVPRPENHFLIGTTFESFEDDQLNRQSQDLMLKQASQFLQSISLPFLLPEEIETQPLRGTLGYRKHSADRFPIIGAAPDLEKLKRDFDRLGQKRILREQLDHYNISGLWFNTAYGSHGIVSSLLGSQHLAALISQQRSPISHRLAERLNPNRFMIRQLKK